MATGCQTRHRAGWRAGSASACGSLETAMADQRKREGAVFMTVAMLPLAPTEAKKSCGAGGRGRWHAGGLAWAGGCHEQPSNGCSRQPCRQAGRRIHPPTCIRMAAIPSPDARSGASRRGKSVASVTAGRHVGRHAAVGRWQARKARQAAYLGKHDDRHLEALPGSTQGACHHPHL